MQNAADIKNWPSKFKPTEWPKNTLQHMTRDLFVQCVFPLRAVSSVPMWASKLTAAHVREDGESMHSTNYYTRLSCATDMHVSSYSNLMKVMACADGMDAIRGIGLYFNKNTPMLHLDQRKHALMWLCTKQGEYIYRENDPVKFYVALGNELNNL